MTESWTASGYATTIPYERRQRVGCPIKVIKETKDYEMAVAAGEGDFTPIPAHMREKEGSPAPAPVVAEAVVPEGESPTEEIQYYIDKLGRKYPLDVFSNRVWRTSVGRAPMRPEWFTSAEWNKMNEKQKCDISPEYEAHLKSKAAHDAVPAEISAAVAEE